MLRTVNYLITKAKQSFQVKKPWDDVIIFVLNLLIAIPIFIIVHQNTKNPNWYFNIDRVLLFVFILLIIQLILRVLRTIIIICIVLYIIALAFGSFYGRYGFSSITEDYRYMIYSMSDSPNPQDLILSKLLPFPNKSKIINAIEYDNRRVRDFALKATTKHFKKVNGYYKYRTIIQCFAVFKEINSRWNYVSDPKGRDYIATASESLLYLSGDCDDHSVLMAACIKSIGGTARLIHTGGHMYPEILIGNSIDLEPINYLIKKVLFVPESKRKLIHYHIDERGQVWLNLDYTAMYPGGPFMSEEILGALTLD
ncbi:transglutaminase [Flavobacterium luteum]|uniref:Transglutaminase n=1 Tax=Flavobacterium luteum TaxID=2026654 RepID=A0A7J5AKM8_9FLAO|nr:transglutaminase [Flavobacterium luteum]KAB1158172.1 transglutaminase [Flavobacterium luteum]